MALARARMVDRRFRCNVRWSLHDRRGIGAEAQVKRSLSGSNLRFQIGGELQIPIAATRKYTPCSA